MSNVEAQPEQTPSPEQVAPREERLKETSDQWRKWVETNPGTDLPPERYETE